VKDQFTKLESTSGDAWQEAKMGMHKAVDELKEAYEKAKGQFK
jgi:hypothetical protein